MTRQENEPYAREASQELLDRAGSVKRLTDWYEALDMMAAANQIDLRGRDAETKAIVYAARAAIEDLVNHLNPGRS